MKKNFNDREQTVTAYRQIRAGGGSRRAVAPYVFADGP